MMATNSDKMNAGQEDLNESLTRCVAVYRFVIINGKACIDNKSKQGIWISKVTTGKKDTYIADLVHNGWEASFECFYSDAGVLRIVKILDLNDELKKVIDWKAGDKEGWNLERGPSQEASGVVDVDRQIMELGEKPCWSMILDTPIGTRGGPKDDNDNYLICFELLNYPLGVNGARREEKALWCAKKELPGMSKTVLSRAELKRFKLEGKIA